VVTSYSRCMNTVTPADMKAAAAKYLLTIIGRSSTCPIQQQRERGTEIMYIDRLRTLIPQFSREACCYSAALTAPSRLNLTVAGQPCLKRQETANEELYRE